MPRPKPYKIKQRVICCKVTAEVITESDKRQCGSAHCAPKRGPSFVDPTLRVFMEGPKLPCVVKRVRLEAMKRQDRLKLNAAVDAKIHNQLIEMGEDRLIPKLNDLPAHKVPVFAKALAAVFLYTKAQYCASEKAHFLMLMQPLMSHEKFNETRLAEPFQEQRAMEKLIFELMYTMDELHRRRLKLCHTSFVLTEKKLHQIVNARM